VRNVAFVGTPNAGKSTLFNHLTGAAVRVGNFVGTTVSRSEAVWKVGEEVRGVDLPGSYSLAAHSPDEAVTFDHITQTPRPDLVIFVADAPRLERSLYLLLQVMDLGLPVVVALNLMDEARKEGRAPSPAKLSELLGLPVVPTVGRSGEGADELTSVVKRALAHPEPTTSPVKWSEGVQQAVTDVVAALGPDEQAAAGDRPESYARWCLLSSDGESLDRPGVRRANEIQRETDVLAEIVGQRYAWIDSHVSETLEDLPKDGLSPKEFSDKLDKVLLHPLVGSLAFLGVMSLVFMALFAWSDPMIGAIEELFGQIGGGVSSVIGSIRPDGPSAVWDFIEGLLVDGIVGGVGSVLVFLPQIALLFLFLSLLEDSGYLSRAAHLMDRILQAAHLPGRAFVPMLSGYACAVPAILATRGMPRFRDRLLTMMVIPLTTCSARLPVYALMIAAVFPATLPGTSLPVRAAALMAMYLLGTATAILAAIVLGRTVLKDDDGHAILELPPYRVPSPRTVGKVVWRRSADFVREAGGIILIATIAIWGLLTYPKASDELVQASPEYTEAIANGQPEDEAFSAVALQSSAAGRIGKAMEPIFEPLGFNWKMDIGLLGAFAAREVFVSTMGVVYGVGGEVDEDSARLHERMAEDKWSDGSPVWTPLTGLSVMVFFAFALQCLSTLAVLRKETFGWKWPLFITGWTFALAYVASLIVYQGGRLLGFA